MPNSHHPPDKTRRSCVCRIRRCKLNRLDRRTSAFCVGVRPAVALRRPTHSDADQTQNAPVWRSGRLNSHRHTRYNKTVLSVSCLAWGVNSLIYFASAAVAVDSSHTTASLSDSWSRFSPPSNSVNGHVSTMWFMVCRWPQVLAICAS